GSPELRKSPPLSRRLAPLILKESREILRDRRTIITLVLMPLLLYPLLTIAFQRFLLSGSIAPGPVHYRAGVPDKETAELLIRCVQLGQQSAPVVEDPNVEKTPVTLETFLVPDMEAQLRDYSVDFTFRRKSGKLDDFSVDENLELDFEIGTLE